MFENKFQMLVLSLVFQPNCIYSSTEWVFKNHSIHKRQAENSMLINKALLSSLPESQPENCFSALKGFQLQFLFMWQFSCLWLKSLSQIMSRFNYVNN